NHHCGFGSINQLSTPERNLLRDGYTAATLADELPCPGLTVSIVRRIVDVTARVHAAQTQARSDHERFTRTQQEIKAIVAEGEAEPDTECRVASFFEGREYHLIVQTVLKDIRLVYAPPRAVGEFGGEVDNWEWPRHTGDFAFFRAYAAPDGTPRAHSKDNVPYRPAHWRKVSSKGEREGALVMVLGYPGRTLRYQTADAVADRAGVFYPQRHRLLTEVIGILESASEASEAKALQYASTIKSLANVQKNALGMITGLRRNRTADLKQAEEEQFTAWIEQSEERRAKWGDVLAELRAIDADERATMEKDALLRLLLDERLLPLVGNTVRLVTDRTKRPDDAAAARRQVKRAFGSPAVVRDLETVQMPLLALFLAEARALPAEQRLAGCEWLYADPDQPIETVVGRLMTSKLLDLDARADLAAQGPDAIAAATDPLLDF